MLHLMKYELLKQKNSKLILGGFLLVAELAFIIGMLLQNDSILGLGIVGLTVTTMIGFFLVALEAIFTYYTDMKEKRGYMLFMTPHSVYTIMASKILTSIVTILVWTLFIGLLAFIDLAVMAVVYSDMTEVIEMVRQAIQAMFAIEVSWGAVALVAAEMIFGWIGTVTSGFLAITISCTLLRGGRFSGFLSFVLYIVLNMIPARVLIFLYKILHIADQSAQEIASFSYEFSENASASFSVNGLAATGLMFVVTLVFTVLCFLGSGRILQKRLSL